MQKVLFLSFIYLFLSHTLLYGENFIIKLASYTNKTQLLHQMAQLDSKAQKNLILRDEEGLYKLYTQVYQSKAKAIQALPHYQQIFQDAYIKLDKNSVDTNHTNTIQPVDLPSHLERHHMNTDDNTSISPDNALVYPTEDPQKPLTMQGLIQSHIYFLCPNSIKTSSEKILLKAQFTDNNVTYTSIIGKVPTLQMQYIIKQNRLYMVRNNRVSISQYATIDKIFFEYLLVSRWMKGKRIHQMRYYKKEEDAKSYLSSIHLE